MYYITVGWCSGWRGGELRGYQHEQVTLPRMEEYRLCRAPVTTIVAIRWTVVSLHATPAEPLDLPEPSLWTGVNQTSATYIKLGMATA